LVKFLVRIAEWHGYQLTKGDPSAAFSGEPLWMSVPRMVGVVRLDTAALGRLGERVTGTCE